MSPPVFILIPGHWHTAHHYDPLIDNLKQHGYEAKAFQLYSVGAKSPPPTFADDVNVVYTAVVNQLNEGHDVCLVLHSVSGMAGAEAICSLESNGILEAKEGRGKLSRIIFIAAYTFPAGFVLDAKDFVSTDNPNFTLNEENKTAHMADPKFMFFNDMSSEDAKQWIDALDIAAYLGRGPVISSENWRKAAPITALLCKQDNATPPSRQEMVWKGHHTEWLDAGHTPYVSHPKEVAKVLIRLATE